MFHKALCLQRTFRIMIVVRIFCMKFIFVQHQRHLIFQKGISFKAHRSMSFDYSIKLCLNTEQISTTFGHSLLKHLVMTNTAIIDLKLPQNSYRIKNEPTNLAFLWHFVRYSYGSHQLFAKNSFESEVYSSFCILRQVNKIESL